MTDGGRLRRTLRGIDWFDQALLAALCLAESAVVWLIAGTIVSAPESATGNVPFWLVAGLIWFAAALPNVLDALDIWDPWYRVVSAIAVAGSLALVVKVVSLPESSWKESGWPREAARSLILRPSEAGISVWLAVALVAYAWWRGHTRSEGSIDSAFRLLRAGAAATLAGAVAFAAMSDERGDSATAVAVFVVFTLIAIGLARVKLGDGGQSGARALRAYAIAFAPVVLVLGLGVLLTGLLSRDLLETILWALSPLLWALGVLVRAVVLIVALTALLILTPIFWLLEGREFEMRGIRFDGTSPMQDDVVREATTRADETPDLIRYVVAAVILLVIFGGVTRFVLRRRRRGAREETDEERTTLRPVFDVRRWLAALRDVFGRQTDAADDPLGALRGDPRWAATVTIRERYREFLVWSKEYGLARLPGTTPAEHGTMLKQKLSGANARDDVDAMAAIYARARYSDRPAAESDAVAIESAWRRLERAGRAER